MSNRTIAFIYSFGGLTGLVLTAPMWVIWLALFLVGLFMLMEYKLTSEEEKRDE